MSRANAKTRAKNDNYPTPMALCREIVKRYDAERLRNARILVPMCGEGRFIRALRERADALGLIEPYAQGALTNGAPLIVGVDIVGSYESAARAAGADIFVTGDVLLATGLDGHYDLIIDNPSFTLAEQLVRKMVPLLAPGGELALLLRQGFRGAGRVGPREEHAGAAPLFTDYPLDEINVIDPRPIFGLNKHGKPGTDGVEYELFTWHMLESGRLSTARLIGDPIIYTPDPAEVQALRDKAASALTVSTNPAAAQQIVDTLAAHAAHAEPAPVLEALDIEL